MGRCGESNLVVNGKRADSSNFARVLTLVSMQAPLLCARVRYRRGGLSGLLPGIRDVQLRGNALVIFRCDESMPPDIGNAERAYLLTSQTVVEKIGRCALLVAEWRGYSQSYCSTHRLIFDNESEREIWYRAMTELCTNEGDRRGEYIPLMEIGTGATSNVYLVEEEVGMSKNNVQGGELYYAMKVVEKMRVMYSESALRNVCAERIALTQAAQDGCVFLTRLKDAFQTRDALYFVTELAHYGDIYSLLRVMENGRLPEQVARSMFAEIVLGLEELHAMGFLYRDLKPENIVITNYGHVKLADFGLVKKLKVVETKPEDAYGGTRSSNSSDNMLLEPDSFRSTRSAPANPRVTKDYSPHVGSQHASFKLLGRANSFVGTRRFMAPEQLKASGVTMRGYGAPADIWALGVTLYLMLTGSYPLAQDASSGDTAAIFMAIREESIRFPGWVSQPAIDLINGMMERDVGERFSLEEIKKCDWLKDVDFALLRSEARKNVPRKEVLCMLKNAGVKSIVEKSYTVPKYHAPDLYSKEHESSTKSDDKLWGFGYRSPTEKFDLYDDFSVSISECSVGSESIPSQH